MEVRRIKSESGVYYKGEAHRFYPLPLEGGRFRRAGVGLESRYAFGYFPTTVYRLPYNR